MKCFLILIKGSFSEWNKLSQSDRDGIIGQFGEYAKKLGELGYMRGGDACNQRSFRILELDNSNSDCLVPPETKDMVTGYFQIEVPNEEEALKMARMCPAFNCGEYVELVPCGH